MTSAARQTRRIVTGHTSSGKAVYLSDDAFVDGQLQAAERSSGDKILSCEYQYYLLSLLVFC